MQIVYELSRDPQLINQYYQLREQCYRTDLDLPDFDGSEQSQDRSGHLIVAHHAGQCYGGVRISRDGHNQLAQAMPDRSDAARLLSELEVPLESCCMWERFALSPRVRTVKMAQNMCYRMIETSRSLGYEYALVLSSLRNARFYRLCHSALGETLDICGTLPSISQGPFSGLEHCLSVCPLQPAIAQQRAA